MKGLGSPLSECWTLWVLTDSRKKWKYFTDWLSILTPSNEKFAFCRYVITEMDVCIYWVQLPHFTDKKNRVQKSSATWWVPIEFFTYTTINCDNGSPVGLQYAKISNYYIQCFLLSGFFFFVWLYLKRVWEYLDEGLTFYYSQTRGYLIFPKLK